MKSKSTKINKIFAGFLMVLMTAGAAQAAPQSFSFGDSINYWNTWGSGDTLDNTKDVIGAPNITGGTGLVDEQGGLVQLNIEYNSYNSQVKGGDLFIDNGSDNNWDYVLTSGGNIFNVSTLNVSASKGDITNSLYTMSDDFTWSGNYRNDHPIGIDESQLSSSLQIGTYSFTDFNADLGTDAIFSSFVSGSTEMSLLLGSNFTIAFGAECANDVIFEQVVNPVPIPGAAWLLGTGVIGLMGARRKKA